MGIILRINNPRAAPEHAIARRVAVYERAKRLQPSTLEELAAIRDTVDMEARTGS